MRRALETYYKFRGMFNSGELERVQAENRISGVKVARLQNNFNTAVGAITSKSNQCKILCEFDVNVWTYFSNPLTFQLVRVLPQIYSLQN